jgi:hypothetical protein
LKSRVPLMAALTEARIRAAKPTQKPYKLFDERGLYLPSSQPVGGSGASGTATEGWKNCWHWVRTLTSR